MLKIKNREKEDVEIRRIGVDQHDWLRNGEFVADWIFQTSSSSLVSCLKKLLTVTNHDVIIVEN